MEATVAGRHGRCKIFAASLHGAFDLMCREQLKKPTGAISASHDFPQHIACICSTFLRKSNGHSSDDHDDL